MVARYEGRPIVEFLADGRQVKLLSGLTFYDSEELSWAVPAGAIVDGASIPRIFWPIIGGPLDGNYRDASIIHDWYCDRRTRNWQATHRTFYEAMLISGVSNKKAKIMYFAVYWQGPRWEERVTFNNLLVEGITADRDLGTRDFEWRRLEIPNIRYGEQRSTETIPSPGESFSEDDQKRIFIEKITEIEQEDYTLDEIDELANAIRA